MSMVEVTIDSIRVSLTGQYRLVILKEVDVERYLVIWIAPETAEAITMQLQGVVVPRPLTHDLLKNVIIEMGGTISHIVINTLQNDTYHAQIVVDMDGQSLEIDSRSSDALALAVRAGVKIFVDEAVMNNAAIAPEVGIDLDTGTTLEEVGVTEEGEEDLEAFRDFVDSLDLDDFSKS